MQITVLDTKGKALNKMTLDESVFGITPNTLVMAQYERVFNANQRQGTSSTKTRGEVSGGGKKPWRQKGTGRARHGSSRSPIWRHGGITFGPKPKSWNLNLPKKFKRLAILSALSKKVTDKNLIIIDELNLKTPNTKKLIQILKAIKVDTRRLLIVLDTNDMGIRKSASNIDGVTTALWENLNAHEVLLARNIVILKNAVQNLQGKYASK